VLEQYELTALATTLSSCTGSTEVEVLRTSDCDALGMIWTLAVEYEGGKMKVRSEATSLGTTRAA